MDEESFSKSSLDYVFATRGRAYMFVTNQPARRKARTADFSKRGGGNTAAGPHRTSTKDWNGVWGSGGRDARATGGTAEDLPSRVVTVRSPDVPVADTGAINFIAEHPPEERAGPIGRRFRKPFSIMQVSLAGTVTGIDRPSNRGLDLRIKPYMTGRHSV